ncbi:hypothetical protein QR680_016354 [Steinernema hermaphroditum]|uniref:Uncharacterized protein n=1 Tax=Steinernema hermaphroditum TaxID=289476 RepID=A0AA39HDG3_9BILA|nr:hypothetical protein QR680_016354 [Steinernema hermaphroditum]
MPRSGSKLSWEYDDVVCYVASGNDFVKLVLVVASARHLLAIVAVVAITISMFTLLCRQTMTSGRVDVQNAMVALATFVLIPTFTVVLPYVVVVLWTIFTLHSNSFAFVANIAGFIAVAHLGVMKIIGLVAFKPYRRTVANLILRKKIQPQPQSHTRS